MSQQAPSPGSPHEDNRRPERPIERTPSEARQGRQGRSMVWVLGIGTAAAVIIIFLLVVFSRSYAPTPNTGLAPKASGPFNTQVHREHQPTGTVVTPKQPAQ